MVIPVTELTNGTSYTFTVTAININGPSIASLHSVSYIPSTIPDPPTNINAIVNLNTITIRFNAPINNGGSQIISYTINDTTNKITQQLTDVNQLYYTFSNVIFLCI